MYHHSMLGCLVEKGKLAKDAICYTGNTLVKDRIIPHNGSIPSNWFSMAA